MPDKLKIVIHKDDMLMITTSNLTESWFVPIEIADLLQDWRSKVDDPLPVDWVRCCNCNRVTTLKNAQLKGLNLYCSDCIKKALGNG